MSHTQTRSNGTVYGETFGLESSGRNVLAGLDVTLIVSVEFSAPFAGSVPDGGLNEQVKPTGTSRQPNVN